MRWERSNEGREQLAKPRPEATQLNTPSFDKMPDERLVRFYEDIRQQVDADRAHERKFMSNPAIRQYADDMLREIIRRGLPYSPIFWPPAS